MSCHAHRDLRWERAHDGRVPRDAVCGGWDANKGEPLYVGRAAYKGNLHVGKIHPSHRCCYIPYGSDEISIKDYEALVNPGNRVRLEWEHDRDGNVPHRAINVGEDSYHIGRHSHYGDTIPGKTHRDHRCLYLSYGGKSHKKSEYEVLCVRD